MSICLWSRHSATRISLCLRSGRGVRGMCVSSVWTWCGRIISLSSVWGGAEEECLCLRSRHSATRISLCLRSERGVRGMCVFGLNIVREDYLFVFGLGRCRRGISICLRSRHSATRISLCLRSGRGVRGMCVFGLDIVRQECLCVFGLDVV